MSPNEMPPDTDRIVLALSKEEFDDIFECIVFTEETIQRVVGTGMANLKCLRSLMREAWRKA